MITAMAEGGCRWLAGGWLDSSRAGGCGSG